MLAGTYGPRRPATTERDGRAPTAAAGRRASTAERRGIEACTRACGILPRVPWHVFGLKGRVWPKMAPVTMLRRKPILLVLGAMALLWPSTVDSPVRAAAAAPEPAPVRIEHQLIRISPPAPARSRPRVSSTVNRLANMKPRQVPRADSFVARAGRLLMGEGRYRPEPFPRPGR